MEFLNCVFWFKTAARVIELEGSIMIFIRSQTIRMAAMISSSETMIISSIYSWIMGKVMVPI